MIDSFFIFLAKYLFVLLFLIAGVFFLKQLKKVQIEMIILGLSVALISYLIALVAGMSYYDPRPFVEGHFKPLIDHDTENGFPSDHVLLTSCAASIVFLYNKTWGFVLWLLVLLIAAGRVYVGVHHPIDVVASIVITVVVTAVLGQLFGKGLMQRWLGFIQARSPFFR